MVLETYWAELLDLKDPLMSFRQKSWDRFEEIGLPFPKQEDFQYLRKELAFPKLAEKEALVQSFGPVPAPLVCLAIEDAFRSYGLFLQNRMAKLLKEETDPFATLNGAFQKQGIFLYVPPKCKAALHLVQTLTEGAMVSPRLHVYLARGSQLHLLQTSQGTRGFSNQVLDFVLDEGAELAFIDEAEGDFQAIRATQKRDSKLKTVSHCKKTRTSIKVQLSEENGEATLLGLARLKENESHIHATVEHIAPHTRSRQHFKSVLSGHSRFSFEGKIHVHAAAQKTEAYQLNNNLLLSDEASANAKPNLEIFADDVKASHGATVGQLDEEQLFYLRSRGLSLEAARNWLIEGFCKEILDHAR